VSGIRLTPHTDLVSGEVVWVALDPVRGREQAGHRPAVVVSSEAYLTAATTLALVVPITSTDRGWPNHVALRGDLQLGSPSWAMTEQLRTISRERITGSAGLASPQCAAEIRRWLADFLEL
jgi:mRNA interferase MazF